MNQTEELLVVLRKEEKYVGEENLKQGGINIGKKSNELGNVCQI